MAQFYVGEVITKIVKTSLTRAKDVLIYTTIMGRIGALVPFEIPDDVDYFSGLEMYLRNENLSLTGREHVSFRSYYMPVKVRAGVHACFAQWRSFASTCRTWWMAICVRPSRPCQVTSESCCRRNWTVL